MRRTIQHPRNTNPTIIDNRPADPATAGHQPLPSSPVAWNLLEDPSSGSRISHGRRHGRNLGRSPALVKGYRGLRVVLRRNLPPSHQRLQFICRGRNQPEGTLIGNLLRMDIGEIFWCGYAGERVPFRPQIHLGGDRNLKFAVVKYDQILHA